MEKTLHPNLVRPLFSTAPSAAPQSGEGAQGGPKTKGAKDVLERFMHLLFLLCGIVAVAFVLCISVYLIISGLPAIQEIGLGKFLLGQTWAPTAADPSYGILPFLLTSVYGTAGAVLIGVPVGLMTAIYLAKVANPRMAAIIHTAVELLAGIPSVVYGLVGMIVLVPGIQKAFGLSSGACLLAAILVLAIMILPSIISVSETALRAVPEDYEQASLALGATHLETVLPRDRSRRPQRRGHRHRPGRGPGHRRGHGHHHGGRQRGQYAGPVPIRPLPDHRHCFGDVLRLRGQLAAQRPVFHRPGAVPVHHAHQRLPERVYQTKEGGLRDDGCFQNGALPAPESL